MLSDLRRTGTETLTSSASGREKRILVVAHDRLLRATRVALLRWQGHAVESVMSDDDALDLLTTESFDLVVIGRTSRGIAIPLAQRLREAHPSALTLQITNDDPSVCSSRNSQFFPDVVLQTVAEMLA